MVRRSAILLAAALTALVLTVAGGAVAMLAQPPGGAAPPLTDAGASPVVTSPDQGAAEQAAVDSWDDVDGSIDAARADRHGEDRDRDEHEGRRAANKAELANGREPRVDGAAATGSSARGSRRLSDGRHDDD